MQKFFTALLLIPLGLILIVFSVANRHLVTVSYDPLETGAPLGSIQLPLFVVIITSAIVGVIAGGGMHNFEQAEGVLARGEADIVSIARQALADPDWFRKIRLGLGDQVRRCQFTNYCEALDQQQNENDHRDKRARRQPRERHRERQQQRWRRGR